MRIPAFGVVSVLASLAPCLAAAQTSASDSSDLVFETLRNHYSFLDNGTGKQEIAARLRVTSEIGVQMASRIFFSYAGESERLEVDYVRTLKPDGSIVPMNPEGQQDLPAFPAENMPEYSDARVRHLTVSALRPGDVIEYSATRYIDKPLVPGHFSMLHWFTEHTAVVDEALEVTVPADRQVRLSSHDPPTVTDGDDATRTYTWRHAVSAPDPDDEEVQMAPPDVQLSSLASWAEVANWYWDLQYPMSLPGDSIDRLAHNLTADAKDELDAIRMLYDFVSTKFRYVSLSFGDGRHQPHPANDVVRNGYGDCKDKHTLFASLLSVLNVPAYPVLMNTAFAVDTSVPSPLQFDHLITLVVEGGDSLWLDTTAEVAPFRVLAPFLRDRAALVTVSGPSAGLYRTPAHGPLATVVDVEIDGAISALGRLDGTVSYRVSGDDEYNMRRIFWTVPTAQVNDAVQMLASNLGLPGTVQSVSMSRIDDLTEPFELRFALRQPNYFDFTFSTTTTLWLPAPILGLEQYAMENDTIYLGGPYNVNVSTVVTLPAGFEAQNAVSVEAARPYASYAAEYSVDESGVRAVRRLEVREPFLSGDLQRDVENFAQTLRTDRRQTFSVSHRPIPEGDSVRTVVGTMPVSDVADLYAAAWQAIQNEQYVTARSLLMAVVEMEPEHDDAWNDLGLTYLREKRFEEALTYFARQLGINSFHEYARTNQGSALMQLGRFDEAIASFNQRLEQNPLDSLANRYLGRALTEAGRVGEGITYLQRAASITPSNGRVYLELADALFRAQRTPDAMAALARGRELMVPRVSADYAILGWAELQAGDYRSARQTLGRALRMDSSNVDAIVQLARAMVELGEADSAEVLLQNAIGQWPDELALHLGYVSFLHTTAGDEAAGAYYGELVQRFPDLLQNTARTLGFGIPPQEDHEEIYRDARAAAEANPDDPAVWARLGQFAFYTDRMEEADAAYRKVAELDAAFFDAHKEHKEIWDAVKDILRNAPGA